MCVFNTTSGIDKEKKNETVVYYKDDTLKLELDLFLPTTQTKAPLLIYVHGGGFATGDRTSGQNICKYAAEHGFAAATISYTLYMKGKSFSCDGILSEKIKAIQMATNQLWLATSFFIEHSEDYKINISKIFIAGSSAGAETCLHAAFWDYETMNFYNKKLPVGFKYAGVIAGSGAIMDLNLIRKDNLLSVMLFHGNCDVLVPYATAAHHYCKTNASGWLMLFGSYSIYNYIIGLGGSTHLVSFCGGGHEYSNWLFDNDQQLVIDFMNQILAGEKVQEHTIRSTGKSCEKSALYNFCD